MKFEVFERANFSPMRGSECITASEKRVSMRDVKTLGKWKLGYVDGEMFVDADAMKSKYYDKHAGVTMVARKENTFLVLTDNVNCTQLAQNLDWLDRNFNLWTEEMIDEEFEIFGVCFNEEN